jgi:comEA protein
MQMLRRWTRLGKLALWLLILGFSSLPECLQGKTVAKSPIPKQQSATSKVNVNRATLKELQTLPGIGPSLAQRILDYRKKNRPFRRVEDLLIIRGISQAKLEKLRDRISVE